MTGPDPAGRPPRAHFGHRQRPRGHLIAAWNARWGPLRGSPSGILRSRLAACVSADRRGARNASWLTSVGTVALVMWAALASLAGGGHLTTQQGVTGFDFDS